MSYHCCKILYFKVYSYLIIKKQLRVSKGETMPTFTKFSELPPAKKKKKKKGTLRDHRY